MTKYEQACNDVGYDPYASGPTKKTEFSAYKSGQVSKHSTRAAAMQIGSLVEEVVTNEKEIEDFKNNQKRLKKEVDALWKKLLIQEYEYQINPAQFDMIYERAADRNDTRDEIEYEIEEIANLYAKLVKVDPRLS